MFRILIVEDDAAIAGVLERRLARWGYEPVTARDFSDVLGLFLREQPHLVLLDISLPFYNGYYWCEEIRRVSKAPILFLTSAGDGMSQVMALGLGADDFIAKPFDLDVLTARVQALLRRAYSFAGGCDAVECGGAVLDLARGTLSKDGERLELTKNEQRILRLLLENRGRTVTREALMNCLWQGDSYVDDNTLTVNVNRLRARLERFGLRGLIATKKGVGYLLEG